MYNPTGFLRAALPAALEAGKAILEIYAQPTEGWEIEDSRLPTDAPTILSCDTCAPRDTPF